jgi:hypothetical protein
MTLIELMVALVVGLLLVLMTVQIFSAIRSGQLLQSSLAAVQEDGRIALSLVAEEVRKAGYRERIWEEQLAPGYFPLTSQSANNDLYGNDRLQIMYMDTVDCQGVLNSTTETDGEPKADYKRVTWWVDRESDTDGSSCRLPSDSRHGFEFKLFWQCEYGPDPLNDMTMQVGPQRMFDGVESFQVLYGVDTTDDRSVNMWATADQINPETTLCLSIPQCEGQVPPADRASGIPTSVQIALLVSSPETSGSRQAQTFTVLDNSTQTFDDYCLRKLYTTTIALRNLTP